MRHTKRNLLQTGAVALCAVVFAAGCSSTAPAKGQLVKKAESKEQSGFLKDYSKLKPDQTLEGNVLTYVNDDLTRNLHGYLGVIVDPVQIYVATDAEPSKISTPNAERTALYFKSALIGAVQDAFPVAHDPGPLVLRLRAAIVGVDAGGDAPSEDGKSSEKTLNISKGMVELELVDSVSGEVIAAVWDKEAAGAGEIGAGPLSREERFQLAKAAIDTWAKRVRDFLNAAHQLPPEDAAKADQAYKPYGGQ